MKTCSTSSNRGPTAASAAEVERQPNWTEGDFATLLAGRYRPERFHARGALGEVFVARDEELDRIVALKRIRPHQAGQDDTRLRFEAEARITGQLEHPGVVPVYGLGQAADGQPVYAMRFIDGETMAEAIDSFHQTGGEHRLRRQNVAFQKLLRRFLSLCQTVAYAHSRQIIHRDIKPANVLLGQFGETLLVDWGLAKHLDERSRSEGLTNENVAPDVAYDATEAGVIKGSPAYMSPEQAEGQWQRVGPASDLYNLGATLFHLVTGTVPFDGDTAKVLERVRMGERVLARAVNPLVPAALDAICSKAMRHDPADRYLDAKQLAHDIECWLADEPIAAWQEPWSTRVSRWVRQHRTLVTTGMVAIVVLATSLSVATVLLSNKNRLLLAAKTQTDAALATTQEERRKAENSLKSALQSIDAMLVQIGRAEVSEIPEMQDIRRKMLEDAVAFLESFIGYEHRPELRREQGLALSYLGSVQGRLGEPRTGTKRLEEAITIQQELLEQFPRDAALVQDLAKSWHELGLQQILLDPRQAEQALQSSVDLLETRPGQPPSIALADAHHRLALLYQSTSRPQQALSSLARAIAIRENAERTARGMERDALRLQLAESLNNLGNLRLAHNEVEAAEKAYRRALETLTANSDSLIVRRGVKNRQYDVYNGLANLAYQRKDLERATDYHHRALEIAIERAGLYPSVPGYRNAVAQSHHNLAAVYQMAQRKEDALREFGASVSIRRELTEQHPEDADLLIAYAESTTSQAHVLSWVDRKEEARRAFEEALRVLHDLTQAHPTLARYASSLCSSQINFGHFLRDQGDTTAALDIHQQVIDRAKEYLDKDPTSANFRAHLFNAHGARANTFLSLGQHANAIADCDGVVASCAPTQREFWMAWRLPTLAQVDHRRAIADVRELNQAETRQGAELFNMALASALSMTSAGRDQELTREEQKELIETYRELSFQLLKRTFASGFLDTSDTQKLLEDVGFHPLHTDKRWKHLTAEGPSPE